MSLQSNLALVRGVLRGFSCENSQGPNAGTTNVTKDPHILKGVFWVV